MTTTTDTTIDFSVWTKEEEVKPRTLREIEREVGFPFATKAVVKPPPPGDDIQHLPTGTVIRFVCVSDWEDDEETFQSDIPIPPWGDRHVYANVPRWVLLGDKT